MLIKIKEPVKIISPEVCYKLLSEILAKESQCDRDKEHFWIIGTTTRHKVRYIDLVSLGILNASLIHPREVFRFAVMQGVCKVLLCHNHPSEEPEPSEEDIEITNRLAEAEKISGIEVLDHIIIAENGFYSFKENGKIIF
jgi:DNA repair protein RadC